MREKTLQLILTFDTTTAAMAMEKLCAKEKLPGRLIPVPRAITANCGMAWLAPPEAREPLLTAASAAGIVCAGWWELML